MHGVFNSNDERIDMTDDRIIKLERDRQILLAALKQISELMSAGPAATEIAEKAINRMDEE